MKNIKTRTSLSELAYQEIKNAIINNRFNPGENLIETTLSEELNVSRTVVQRALIKLEAEGLVVKDPLNNRTYVRNFSRKEIENLWEIRTTLESLAVKKAARKRSKIDLQELESFFTGFIGTTKFDEMKLKLYQKQDRKFHYYITRIADNRLLCDMFNKFSVQIDSFSIGIFRFPHKTVTEHLKIIEAVKRQDEDQAEKLMKSHLHKKQADIDKMFLDIQLRSRTGLYLKETVDKVNGELYLSIKNNDKSLSIEKINENKIIMMYPTYYYDTPLNSLSILKALLSEMNREDILKIIEDGMFNFKCNLSDFFGDITHIKKTNYAWDLERGMVKTISIPVNIHKKVIAVLSLLIPFPGVRKERAEEKVHTLNKIVNKIIKDISDGRFIS